MKIKYSITFKIMSILLIALAIATSLFGYFLYLDEKSKSKIEIEKILMDISERISNSLVSPIWNYVDEDIEKTVFLEMGNKHVLGIIAKDDSKTVLHGKIKNELWEIVDYTADEEQDESLSLSFLKQEKEIVKDEGNIGFVEVYFTDFYLKKGLKVFLRNIIFQTIVLFAVINIILFLINKVFITKPLNKLEESAKQLAQGNLDQNIDTKGKDELGNLARNFAAMRDAIRKKIQDLNTLNKTGEILAGLRNQTEAIETVIKVIREQMNLRTGAIYLVNQQGELALNAYYPENSKMPGDKNIKFGKGIVGKTAEQKQIIFIPDTSKETELITNDQTKKSQTLLSIPIFDDKDIFGVMNFSGDVDKVKYNNEESGFPEAIARLTAVNMKNIQMTQELEEYSRTLEQKVKERTEELNVKNIKLNETLIEVEEANKHIIESIQYAKIIQSSLLPDFIKMTSYLPDNFVIWLPRDIVGGDIIFTDSVENGFVFAVMDCTGHGVPGAFMTMLASTGIKRIIVDEHCYDPAKILKRLNLIVKTSLKQDKDNAPSDDGLDAAVCFVKPKEKILTFAGAKLPLVTIYKNELSITKGDKQSLGYKRSDLDFNFTNYTIPIKKGMSFYMYSDGYLDQLGGKSFFSFGKKRLLNLLTENNQKPFENQRDILLKEFHDYKAGNERQDDVTIVGFSVYS